MLDQSSFPLLIGSNFIGQSIPVLPNFELVSKSPQFEPKVPIYFHLFPLHQTPILKAITIGTKAAKVTEDHLLEAYWDQFPTFFDTL